MYIVKKSGVDIFRNRKVSYLCCGRIYIYIYIYKYSVHAIYSILFYMHERIERIHVSYIITNPFPTPEKHPTYVVSVV